MPKILLFICVYLCSIYSISVNASVDSDLVNSNFDIELNFESYTVSEGLSQGTVTSIIEDEDGYIWIGTINGLNRFDGLHFKHFYADENSGLPSSFIRNLTIDKLGRIIIGTDKGLVIYNSDKENFEKTEIDEAIKDEQIWSLSHDNDGYIIGLKNKIIILDDNLKNIKYSFTNNKIKEIKRAFILNNSILIRNYDGVIYEIKDNLVKVISEKSIDIIKKDQQILISKESGLYSYKDGFLEKISEKKFDNLFSEKERDILAISDNELDVISQDGSISKIGIINNKSFQSKSKYISRGDDKIFISDLNKGFYIIKSDANYVKKLKSNIKNVWSMTNNKKNIFIVSDDQVIYKYSMDFKLISKIKMDIPSGSIFLIASNDNLYVGTTEKLLSLNLATNKIVKITDGHITHLNKKNDNTFIAGTFDGDIFEFNDNNEITNKIDTNINYPIHDTLMVDSKLWIASQDGIFISDGNKYKKIFNDDLSINLMRLDNKVIFGTRTSLYSINKDDLTIKEIIKNKKITYSINKIKNIVVSNSNGEINLLYNENIYTLNESNGVLEDYNVQSAMVIDDNLFLGGTTGISLIEPQKLISQINDEQQYKVQLQDLLLFNSSVPIDGKILNKSINNQKEITLRYSDYPFSIKFNINGYKSNRFEFYYYLEDLEKQWVPAKENNSATYTNLSQGSYTFKVHGIDLLTKKTTETKILKIQITPPWWLSIEAKVFYAILILSIIIFLIKSINRRRQIQKQIAQSEERLKLSLWGSGDEMWDWDIESGKIYRSNIWGSLDFPQDGRRSGNPDEESNIHPLDRERVTKALNDHFSALTDHFEIAYRVKARNQQWIWILDRAKIVERDQKDRPLRMTGTIKDINNIKQAEEQLRLFARAIENISEGMFILDEKYQFVEVNEACCELSELTREKFVDEILNFTRYPASYSEQIRNLLKQQGRWSGEIEASKGKDNFFLMELTIDAIYNEQGETSHYVGVFSDITRRKQQEEELRKLTNNDLLTGLPNRSSLQVTLSNLVKKDIHHTLMVLDLDNFKRINDSLGHQIGDDLLIGVAERIKLAIPKHASLYRLGGDEFALLVDQHPDIGACAAIATQVINCLKPAFILNNDSLVLGISIGIVLYPEDEQNEQALLRKADIAMYHAKSGGGNRYQFYSESLNQNALRQLEIETLIREALKDDLFEVYYQPKIDVKKDRLTGMEALVRLNHPKLGLIGPNEFIPLAEENGLIVEIGDVVLRKACFAAQKWLESGLFSGRVAVNLSSRQFALPDLQQRIESILRLTKLPAKHLELEITEGTVIKNPEQAIKVMQQLAKMGVSLALDDFGTGYSSLSYLKRFPINCLKIDKTFVDDIDKSDRDLKMVDSIITIAHNMGLTVVGEGVEQTAQLNILKALNCEEIQGYIYSKPIREADFELMLAADKLKFDTINEIQIKK